MTNGKVLLGIILFLIGLVFLKMNLGKIYAIIFIILGTALIIFKNSDKEFEQRKDIKTKKNN